MLDKEHTNDIHKSCTDTDHSSPAIYLLPVTLSDGSPEKVLPRYNIDIIKRLSYFVVENIRTARRFLKKVDKAIDINSLSFAELNEHTSEADIPSLLEPIKQGHSVGVMSEAGCPAVADPGAKLVSEAQRLGIRVVPLVGPSSILLALMASGMNGQCFTFNGYLPIEEKARENALRNMASQITRNDCTQIFIETPYRNNKLLNKIISVLPGGMKLCVAADITGDNETIVTHSLSEWRRVGFDYDKVPAIYVLGR
ncbi:MAG: SAM-dependent methyltransferase [Muribaculaceae bacterium]|nr:SAM-dependent methyltransferase [Muribaculaceae bacterium]